MSELGKLFYSLGLDTTDFNSKIEKAKEVVKSLGGGTNSVNLNTDKIDGAIQKMADLKTKVDELKSGSNRVPLTFAVPKDVVVNDVRLGNLDALRTALQTALSGIEIQNVSINTAILKNQLRNEVWNIEVVADQNAIQKVAARIRQFLTGNSNIKVAVSPDMSDKNIQQLRKKIETELNKSVLKGIKLDIDKKKIQDQLNGMHLVATIDVKVNKASAQAAVDNAVGGTKNISQGNNALNQRGEIQQRVNKRATDELGIRRSINDQMSRNTQLATILGNAMGNVFGAYMLKNFLESLIQIGGEIQKQRLALGHIIDNVANANALFEQMKQLAVKSPFGLLDLMQNARQLSAFGVEYNQLYDTMKRLSDMAAGLGIQFSRLALAYGETKERGFLDGKLVRQFSYMGLPVLQKVAEYYTQIDKLQNGSVVTAAQVRSMVSDKAVSFEDVDAVIKKMTEEGGQFYNMQEVMAESVAGKWKNLKDAIDIMYSDIVESNSAILKAPAAILTSLTKNYDILAGVLAVVAARLVGQRVALAMNTTILGHNSAALLVNKKMQQELTIAAIKKNGTFKSLNAQEKIMLANLQTRGIAEMKQLIRTGQLTKGDAQRLIMMKQISQEQINYLMRLKLISKEEVDAAMNMTRFGIVVSSVDAAIKSLFTISNGLFLLGTILAELFVMWQRNSEKQKEFNDGIRQSAEDFRKATAQMADEVNGLNFDSMSFGERETEIKSMVEYIKDNVPDAERKLADIFKTGTDGKFVKSSEDIFKALKNIVNEMEELSLVDLTEWENSTREVLDKLDLPDYVDSYMKSRSELVSKFNKILGDMKASDRNAILDKFKSQYKDVLMEAFNLSNEEDLKKKSQEQLLGIITSNKDLLHKFLNSNQDAFKSIMSGTKNYWGIYLNEYDKTLASVATSMATLKNKIENKQGKLDWKLPSNQEKWARAIDVTVTTEYKDKTSEEQKMIKQLMTNPEILTMLGVHKGTVDEFAKKVLNDSDIRKNVYLNIMTMYDGKVTQDPWADIMKGVSGKLNTDGTVVDNKGKITEQIQSAYTALKEAQQLSKFSNKVQKTQVSDKSGNVINKWVAKASNVAKDEAEAVDAYANDLSTFQKNLDTAIAAGHKLGIDTDKIINEAEKKFNKKENGTTSSKKDTYLESIKEQFDEVKKAYSEFNKWAVKIGKDNAAKELGKQGGLLAGLNLDDFASPSAYLKKIQKMIADFRTKVGNDNARKKQLTSMLQLEADIKLNIREEEIKNAMSKAEQEINKLAKQFDIFKALLGVGKSEDEASQIALSVVPVMDKKASWYQKELVKQATELGLTLPTDMSLYMDDKQADDFFKKLGADGMGSVLLPIYKQLRDAMVQAGYDSANAIVDVLKNSDNYILKSNAIENALTTKVDAINASSATNKEELIAEARKQANEQLNKLMVDSLKKSLNWDLLFSDLNNTKIETLDGLEKTLEAMVQSNKDIDPTNLKTIYELIDKIRNAKVNKEGLFSGIADSVKNLKDAQNALKALVSVGKVGELGNAFSALNNARSSGNIKKYLELLSDNKKYKFNIDGAEKVMTLKEYLDALAQSEANVAKGTSLVNKNIKEFSNRMSSINNIVKNISGVVGGGDLGDMVTSISSSMTSITTAFSNIDWSKGFFGGGIDNVINNMEQMTSVASSIGSIFGAIQSYQSAMAKAMNEYLDAFGDNLTRISDQIIERLEKKLANATSSADFSKSFENLQEQYETKISNLISSVNRKLDTQFYKYQHSYKTPKKASAIGEGNHSVYYYMKKGGYGYENWNDILSAVNERFGLELAEIGELFTQSLDVLYYVQSEYADAIAQDANLTEAFEEIIKYREELEGLSDTAMFLGTTWDDFKSNFISACQDMDSSVSDLANNIYDNLNNAIIDAMIDAQFSDTLKGIYDDIGKYYRGEDGHEGGFTQGEIQDIKDRSELLAQQIVDARNALKDAGLLIDTDTESSASSSIKGVSEETASILASYINGMRMDLSLQRIAVETIRDAIGAGDGTRSLNAIAEAQLTELNSIVTHTYNTHQELVALNSRIDDVINGTKALHVE